MRAAENLILKSPSGNEGQCRAPAGQEPRAPRNRAPHPAIRSPDPAPHGERESLGRAAGTRPLLPRRWAGGGGVASEVAAL